LFYKRTMHAMPLITTMAAALGLALVLGMLALKLRLPALVGYLLAGVVIGPFTPGFVADVDLASQLAEIGVMLLMFGVGLHFSLDDLLAVRKVALPGALVQMAAATGLGWALGQSWGWTHMASLIFGLSLSVASTVVLLRALEAQSLTHSHNGKVAIGWLVVEDLAMVLVLVLLPALAGSAAMGAAGGSDVGAENTRPLWAVLGQTLLAVAAFLGLMLMGGKRVLPWMLWQVSKTGSRELFTLCVMAVAVGIAYGSAALFGVSVALGAFFAGLVLRESEFSARAAEESLPFRDAFAVLFFVSVGMLFDPQVLLTDTWKVLATTLVIMVGKSLAAFAVVIALRQPLNGALTVSASLAQIGEFSFILATLGISLGVMPPEARSLIVAGALISIALNPLMFSLVEPMRQRILKRSAWARTAEARIDDLGELPSHTARKFLARHVVLVGCGRVGQVLAQALRDRDIPFVAVDSVRERVEALREAGMQAVAGDARDALTLVQAHVGQAKMMIVCASETTDVRPLVMTARTLNPEIQILVRSPSAEEAQLLESEGAQVALHPHGVMAQALLDAALARWSTGASSPPPQNP
jgi:CPA2 family monovalent cation:H+ antiporter-2